jgi:hypothetical protein
MSAPENFFTRWSRRKRADSQPPASTSSQEPADRAPKATQNTKETASKDASPAAEPGFDISKLPPIESITAASDIRAFLAPGVPAELTRAALRRAWAADPAIRDFVGLSENSWDFNAPGAIAGFGPLEMTDQLRRQIADMVGRSITNEPRKESSATQAGTVTPSSVETSAKSAARSSACATQDPEGTSEKTAEACPETLSRGAANNKVSEQKLPDVAAQHPQGASVAADDAVRKRLHGGALPK